MNLIKAAGLICLFLSVSFIGFISAQNLTNRANALENICVSITKYKTLVSHSGKEISYILPESFSSVSFVNFSGNSPRIGEPCPLKIEDKKLLKSFFSEAGSSSKAGENTRCDYYFEAFSSLKKDAVKTAAEKKKIYIVSGICSALASVVVFV